ncbi:MAG: TlpA disulfide reductase family protein [Verrucomicrobiota bacterium]
MTWRWFFLTLLLPFLLEGRTWTLTDGSQLEGDVIKCTGGSVMFEHEDGGKTILSLKSFNEADQAIIRERFPDGAEAPKRASSNPNTGVKPSTGITRVTPSAPLTREQINRLPANKQPKHPGLARLNVGQVPPAVRWRLPATMEYTDMDLTDYRGKILIVQFWASWVPNSMKEMQSLAKLYPSLRRYGIEVIGVNMDERRGTFESYDKQMGQPWRSYFDPKRDNQKNWGLQALPTNVLIDQNGTIVAEHVPVNKLPEVLRNYVIQRP